MTTDDVTHFTRHDDGTLTADHWTLIMRITTALLDDVDDAFIRRDGDTITIRVSNGQALYRIVGHEDPDVLLCELLKASIQSVAGSLATQRAA
jgi:hypothetical protein